MCRQQRARHLDRNGRGGALTEGRDCRAHCLKEQHFLLDNLAVARSDRADEPISEQNAEEGAEKGGPDHAAQHGRRLVDHAHRPDDPKHRRDDAERRQGVSQRIQRRNRLHPLAGMGVDCLVHPRGCARRVRQVERHQPERIADERSRLRCPGQGRRARKQRRTFRRLDIGFDCDKATLADGAHELGQHLELLRIIPAAEARAAEGAPETRKGLAGHLRRVAEHHCANRCPADEPELQRQRMQYRRPARQREPAANEGEDDQKTEELQHAAIHAPSALRPRCGAHHGLDICSTGGTEKVMTGSTDPAPDQSRPDRRGAFILLFFALMAIGAGNTMLLAAVLPQLTRELDMPDWMAGAVFSLSALLWSLASPFWGERSNRWGRRTVAAIGLAGYSISMLLIWLTGALALGGVLTNIAVIFVCLALARSLFGLIGSAANPAAQAYVADRTSKAERQSEIAFLSSGFSVGSVVGPAFAAALVGLVGILAPALFTALLAALMAALIWFRLPEQRAPVTDAVRLEAEFAARGLWYSDRVLPFLVYAVGLSLVTGVLTQVFVFAVMDKLGVGGREAAQYTGPAFTVGALAVLLAQLVIIPRLNLRNKTLMWAGCIPLIIGTLIIVFAQDFASLLISQFLIGLGQGLARPGFSSGASLAVSPQLQGNVAGLVISANGMGYIVTPFFGLFFYEYVDRALPFYLCAAMLLGMLLYARFGMKDGLGEVREDEPSGS